MKCEALCSLHALFGRRRFVFTDRTCVLSVVTASFFPNQDFPHSPRPINRCLQLLSEVDRLCFGAAFFFLRMLKNEYNSFVLSEGVLPNSFAVCRF